MTNEPLNQKGADVIRLPHDTRPGPERKPWTRGLSDEEQARPGSMLLAMLIARANENGQHLNDMARELGVVPGYLQQLRSGLRKFEHIGDPFARACALYLGVPRMTVLLAAARVKPTDVFEDEHEMLQALPCALRYIQGDAQVGPLMPTEVFKATKELQLFVVTLYEMARGRKLLPGQQDPAEIARAIQKHAEDHERLRQQVEADKKEKAERHAREDESSRVPQAGE